MAGIIDEVTLERSQTENARLKRELHAAMLTITKLLEDLSKKNEKIGHMESLVTQVVPVIKKETPLVQESIPAEEQIAETQLERLRLAAQGRTLTLEEIRAYDLLVKNKRLSQDKTTINLSKGNYRDVSDTDLLQIAAKEVKHSDDREE